MRVLVAAENDDLGAKVSKRFGQAPVFLLFDAETGQKSRISGVGDEGVFHGAHRLAELRVDKVATGNIGPHAFDELRSANVQVYVCRHMTVREAVDAIGSGSCAPATAPTLKHSVHQHRDEHHDDGSGPHGHGSGHGPHHGGGGRGRHEHRDP